MDKESILNIIDVKIKNCTKDFKEEICKYVLDNYDNKSIAVKNIVKFIRNKYKFPASGTHCLEYWTSRGHSIKEASVILFEQKAKSNKIRLSPYSRDFWMLRINPLTGINYTEDEADFERNSRRPIRKEYWLKKGFSEKDSIELAQNTKSSNNKKGSSCKDKLSINNKKTIEYWTLRGYSLEEAKSNISELQKTFSLDICIEKYGEIEGHKIWQDRQNKWQDSLLINGNNDNSKKVSYYNMIGKQRNEIIDRLISLGYKNVVVCLTLDELKSYIENILHEMPYYMYCGSIYVFNKLKKYNYYFINKTDDEIIEFIDNSFKWKNNTKFKYDFGRITSYRLYTEEGYYLRSSAEINFYELCKQYNINFLYENNYVDSTLKYDFYLPDYDLYIEIAGLLDNDDYYKNMLYKQDKFGAIILLPSNIYQFIKDLIDGNFNRSNYRLL